MQYHYFFLSMGKDLQAFFNVL
uniref:Uncharacterized protein n=1 Tax=Nelumbo nucifera TaxID=4432 RepID=A0A822XL38_NELNU|nr:TPA_asm: hypothetical protein HUJ06_022175 [Nelumbo nucifera]